MAKASAARPSFVGARVYNSASISIDNDTETDLTFDSVRFDQGGLHGAGAPARLVAPFSGYYHIGGCVQWQSDVTSTIRNVGIRYNGTGNYLALNVSPRITAANLGRRDVDTVYLMAAGEYVTLTVYQDSGIPMNVVVAANNSPEFWMYLLARQ